MSKYESAEYQNAVRDFVRREVGHCVSSLVSTLAQAYGTTAVDRAGVQCAGSDLASLAEQAFELCCGVPDYEEAAIQEGWKQWAGEETAAPPDTDATWWYKSGEEDGDWFSDPRELCESENIEPYESEVYEHWIVSTRLANRLEEKGERIDKDFAGLCVWGRTCTGQAILLDRVICEIYDAVQASVA